MVVSMKIAGILLALISPLVATEAVKGILFVLGKLYDLMADCFPANTTIVQSAITLTTSHSTVVAILLSAFAVYLWQTKNKKHLREIAMGTAMTAAMVAPASLFLFAR